MQNVSTINDWAQVEDVREFFTDMYNKYALKLKNENQTHWSFFIRFIFKGKKCALAFYGYGLRLEASTKQADMCLVRTMWPCLYVQTSRKMDKYDFSSWENDTTGYIHGGVTFSAEPLLEIDKDIKWVGCDFNHSGDLHHTSEQDIDEIVTSIEGLISVAD